MATAGLRALQGEIQERQQVNTDNFKFVPYTWLKELLTTDKISAALECSSIEEDERLSVATTDQYVNKDHLDNMLPLRKKQLKEFFGVKKLKEERTKFMEGKEPTECKGDPEYKKLNRRISEREEWAGDFKSTQYMFLIPTFPQATPHRIVSDYMRLPFLSRNGPKGKRNEAKDRPSGGNFGFVFKERLPPLQYGSADDLGLAVVRKELKSRSDEAYKSELRCLRLLNLIRHPCILQLYGSYTHKKRHSFLFREANGGDLHEFLAKETRPVEFESDQAIYLAMCGLASLDQLHDYCNEELSLKMIGCHHNLKPRNVLIDGASFVLADFGLSTMTNTTDEEAAKTMAQDRDLYFAAPEGMDYLTLDKHELGPPADIWSFGCIVATILTYTKEGPSGIAEFSDSRLVTVSGGVIDLELRAFHDGLGSVNPGVVIWLNKLENDATSKTEVLSRSKGQAARQVPAEVDLIRLIRDMLTIAPSSRPRTTEVLRCLRLITLKKIAEPIAISFEKLPYASDLEFLIEQQVFLEWLRCIDLAEKKKNHHQAVNTDESFKQAYNTLYKIGEELEILLDADNYHPLFSRLRRLNEKLISTLEMINRRSLRRMVELNIIPTAAKLLKSLDTVDSWTMVDTVDYEIDDSKSLASGIAGLLQGSDNDSPNSNLLALLAASHVNRLIRNSKSPLPKLNFEQITLDSKAKATRERPTFRLGTVASSDDFVSSKMDVIIEEMEIGPDFAKEEISSLLFQRLENVLALSSRAASTFRALICKGLYYDEERHTIGLVYSFPQGPLQNALSHGVKPRVLQLAEVIRKHEEPVDYSQNIIVSIDERLRLAYNLVTTVFEFHKIRWLHKNISSYNIIFFDTEADDDDKEPQTPRKISLASPSLIGFSHSRPDEAFMYSNKLYGSDELLFAFHHPNYGGIDGKFTPYCTEYDYYSLGLVLLEIGLWWPLETIMSSMGEELSREEKRLQILSGFVPFLAGSMGEVYAEVVRTCLSDGEDGLRKAGNSVDENFERLVVTPLECLLEKMGNL
ncbi:hypothetical protein THARTR1_04558 [Trichoderma harzianum]|uniref:Protein kinase domain-containing protein n=1 Tax=Trichoderma harzianum TaxID=5544 RepID=A0A2K0UAR4_TRIHA|nr:hypothetical protein THARTR1_04558 [Trichoderma harzianum]